ncbi:MAG TPA: SDR family oxidoreductase [Candidatus Butyricimonas faecavium]|nr:SDR family oxidoreductase [Candidatus Butyricimonas faecavium]
MKYAVVTGGTKGIGLGIVKVLLERGFYVFTNYARDKESAKRVEQELGQWKDRLSIVQADQSDKESFTRFVQIVKAKAESINCIVCNAGMTIRKPNMEITDEQWEQVMQVAINSHFYLVRDCHEMIEPDSRIIFIGSMMGVLPHGTSLPYGVSKAAVHALAKNLVKEFEGTGTTVNAIAPGFVETEWQKNKPQNIRENIYGKTAIKRFATVDEIANAVAFCLDNQFVNGSIIEVSGGYCFK